MPTGRQVTDWYDYPQYFDLAFADETRAEADFIEAACRRFAVGPVRTLLEPGCGGGRLVVEMARRGYRVLGCDNNPRMLAYVRRRIARGKLPAEVFAADMTEFTIAEPVDAAFNTFNTFRHLTTEADAVSHLRSMAGAVRPGGIFILGFHLLPPDADDECIERWTAHRGKTRVTYTLRVLDCNRAKRLEQVRITMLARTPRKEIRCSTEFPLRLYNAGQFRRLIRRIPELELCATYNFDYLIDQPLPLDDRLSDAVFVFRNRSS